MDILVLLVFLAHIVRAEKLIVTKHDEFLDTDTNFFDSEGNKVYLDQYEGSTILLVFWATWCGPCMRAAVEQRTSGCPKRKGCRNPWKAETPLSGSIPIGASAAAKIRPEPTPRT